MEYFYPFTYHLVKFLNPSYPAVKSRFLGGTFKYMFITDYLAVFLPNYGQVNKIALELQSTAYKLLKFGLVRDVFFSHLLQLSLIIGSFYRQPRVKREIRHITTWL